MKLRGGQFLTNKLIPDIVGKTHSATRRMTWKKWIYLRLWQSCEVQRNWRRFPISDFFCGWNVPYRDRLYIYIDYRLKFSNRKKYPVNFWMMCFVCLFDGILDGMFVWMGCVFDVFFHPAVVVSPDSICVGNVSFSHRYFGTGYICDMYMVSVFKSGALRFNRFPTY